MITDEELREHGITVTNIDHDNAIELDWFRPDQEWRSFRLQRVAGYLRAIADYTGNYALLQKLARIQDNKGSLFAYWHELPNDEEKTVLKNAWDAECEDGEFIEHELEEKYDK